jgi:hypothetical protein
MVKSKQENLEIEGNIINRTKGSDGKSTADIILNRERL